MDFSLKFDTVKSGRSTVYIQGSQALFKNVFFLKIDVDLANSADPDEMPHYATFHMGRVFLQNTRLGVSGRYCREMDAYTYPYQICDFCEMLFASHYYK